MTLVATLCAVLDGLALVGLATTPEVAMPTLGAAASLFLLSRLFRARLPDRWAIFVFGAILAVAAGLFRVGHFIPLALAANVTPFIQATIWFCGDTPRWRNWRLSISFLELILAASMNPDFYLSMLILLFLAVAIFRIMISYLAEWCGKYRVKPPHQIARTLLGAGLAAVALMLLTGAMIFPFLPRMASKLQPLAAPQAQVGYTEEVNVSEWLKMSGQGGGDTLLRVYLPTGADTRPNEEVADYLFGGLMRAKVLDHFDGASWKPSIVRDYLPGVSRPKIELNNFQDVALELIREPISSLTLPVPYGTRSISLAGGGQEILARRINTEFVDETSYGKRLAYTVHVALRRGGVPLASLPHDLPIVEDLHVPGSLNNDRLHKLSRDIFGRATALDDKIQHLRVYFRPFGASVSGETLPTPQVPGRRAFAPVERFLFLEKAGHCELFSTAAALLLRMENIPARMVAGFRVTHGTSAGVLSLRQGDAHAWVEYWDPDSGWRVLDVTPRPLMPGGFLSSLQDVYDRVSGLWFQYVLSYDSITEIASNLKTSTFAQTKERQVNEWSNELKDSVLHNLDLVIAGAVVVLLLAVIAFIFLRSWFPWIFSIRKRVRQGPPELSRERTRMERGVYRKLHPWRWLWSDERWATIDDLNVVVERRWGGEALAEFSTWAARYRELRFGGKATRPSADEMRSLRESRRRFSRIATSA